MRRQRRCRHSGGRRRCLGRRRGACQGVQALQQHLRVSRAVEAHNLLRVAAVDDLRSVPCLRIGLPPYGGAGEGQAGGQDGRGKQRDGKAGAGVGQDMAVAARALAWWRRLRATRNAGGMSLCVKALGSRPVACTTAGCCRQRAGQACARCWAAQPRRRAAPQPDT